MPGIYFVIELWFDRCHDLSMFSKNSTKKKGQWEYKEHIVTIKRGGVYIPGLRHMPPFEYNAIGNMMCEIECGWMCYGLLTWIGGLNFVI